MDTGETLRVPKAMSTGAAGARLSPVALTEHLHRTMPAAKAMEIRIEEITLDHVRASAPIARNLNDHGSAFGGSVASLAILTGWARLHALMREHGVETGTVIQQSELRFVAPATKDLDAVTERLEGRVVDRFLRSLRRFGKGRLEIRTEVRSDGAVVAVHTGAYAAGVEEAVERP